MVEESISIITPAYNAAQTLGETIESVQAQTMSDWFMIIVDDGSTDSTLEIAQDFAAADMRITVMHQENQGSAGAYNTGVRDAQTDWICICSADDLLLPEHLQGIADAIRSNPGFGIYSTNGYLFMSDGSMLQRYEKELHVFYRPLADVIIGCFYSVGAVFNRKWFDLVGGFREGVYGEDWDFWLRIMAEGATQVSLPQKTALHRVNATQKSADAIKVAHSDIAILKYLRRYSPVSKDDRRAIADSILLRRRKLRTIRKAESDQSLINRINLKKRIRDMVVALIGEANTKTITRKINEL